MQRTRTEDEVPAKLGHVPGFPHELWILEEQPLYAHSLVSALHYDRAQRPTMRFWNEYHGVLFVTLVM